MPDYPPRHKSNGTRHHFGMWLPDDAWPGDTYTAGGKTWRYASDGSGWRLMPTLAKVTAA